MPNFAYSARREGELIQGTRAAASALALAQELRASGAQPVKIEAEADLQKRAPVWRWRAAVDLQLLVIFSHQMASLMQAGVPIVKAIHTLAESAKHERLQEVLGQVAGDLEGGMDVASCFSRHPGVFSELFVSLLRVGENTGRLDLSFRRLAHYLTVERETRRRINAATRYPMFVMIALAIAIVVLNTFVIPSFAEVFAKYGADLPWQTRAIIGVSDVFVHYWPFGLSALLIGTYATFRFVRTPQGRLRWHALKLRIPVLGSIFERIYLARFCQTFAMVSRAGVPVVQGLNVVARSIGSAHMAEKVTAMGASIERGESITSTARAAGLFTPVILQMMAVGEETGNMDELLDQAAGFYEEEVDFALKGLTEALEPLLIVAIAVLVLIMALGVFLPMWDLNSVAG